jgi:hypothetical protein
MSQAAASISRRRFLGKVAGVVPLAAAVAGEPAAPPQPFFRTRGVVLVPEDLSLTDWPGRAKRAGLTTIALHHAQSPQVVVTFIKSDAGRRFLGSCRELGLQVEYELHAMSELLPRARFAQDPSLFRMNEQGDRTADANLCVHSDSALETAAEQATSLARTLKPTTGRYFFWGDDGRPWCRCPRCRDLSDADQAVLLGNHLLRALRRLDPAAQLAHLAYANTLAPPTKIKPAPGIFLEFAPINRRYDIPYAGQTGQGTADRLELLDANLALFGAASAQALEYWLDVSRFSKWRKPAVKLPWDRQVFAADLDTYGRRGLRHLTSFAVFIDADYLARHGEPPLDDYGALLRRWQP